MINPDFIFNNILINNFDSLSSFDKMLVDVNGNPSILLKYIIANNAKEYFKHKIDDLDQNGIYMHRKDDIDINPKYWEIDDVKLKMNSLNEAKEKWKLDHKKYYRMQPCLPSSKDLMNDIKINIDVTLEEAVQGYKSANDILKCIPNESLDEFCIDRKEMLNYEFKNEYDEFVNKVSYELDIPSRDDLIKLYPIKVAKSRLCLNRQPYNDPSAMNNYINNFMNCFEKIYGVQHG